MTAKKKKVASKKAKEVAAAEVETVVVAVEREEPPMSRTARTDPKAKEAKDAPEPKVAKEEEVVVTANVAEDVAEVKEMSSVLKVRALSNTPADADNTRASLVKMPILMTRNPELAVAREISRNKAVAEANGVMPSRTTRTLPLKKSPKPKRLVKVKPSLMKKRRKLPKSSKNPLLKRKKRISEFRLTISWPPRKRPLLLRLVNT